ncbi:hypothetical protein H8R23_13445 [Flavobacterium sp. F-380]|uniref:DUF4401 domain-containing protein n=1 Tax=Flavobacterium kayseriense TaxID=2764714 RepID=A0ABR7JA93_9FLAO|nr:hypothetical protein [Flavobacterium kayseriense]MBC5842416.1 hypothetical protein [Flavobacterium kayseriense]MBC5848946.1 hypothetical protein [Flavobacterium kayseriense]
MIVYDKTIVQNNDLLDEAQSLKKAGFIDKVQYDTIIKELVITKTHDNILVRALFFILGVFLYSSICGFLALISLEALDTNYEYLVFFFAIVGFLGTEILARSNFYGHGLDDAFIIGSQLTLAIAVGIATDFDELVMAAIITGTALVSYLRYLHLSVALLFCLALTYTLVLGIFELDESIHAFLPFIMMVYALTLFFSSKTAIQNLATAYYHKGLLLAQNFTLILFYFSGNYLVVRELSVALLGQDVAIGSDIPFAFIFYAFTFIVPTAYLVLAVLKKERILLWIGLLSFCFSVYSIRFYYSIVPIEIVLTIGGAILFTITLFTIRKLKNKETGITFQPDRFTETNAFLTAEILVTSQIGSIKPELTTESPIEFGGGDFSGGGSGGSF